MDLNIYLLNIINNLLNIYDYYYLKTIYLNI